MVKPVMSPKNRLPPQAPHVSVNNNNSNGNARRRSSGVHHNSAYLKNIGCGNGFMLPDRVFLYKARRSYLCGGGASGKGRLEPPPDFLNKKQSLRHRAADENKTKIASSTTVHGIGWAANKEAEGGDIAPTNKIYLVEDASYGFQPKGRAWRANNKAMSYMASSSSLQDSPPFVWGEWEAKFEAGVHFWLNVRTGECRTEISSLARAAADVQARRATTRPAAAGTTPPPPTSSLFDVLLQHQPHPVTGGCLSSAPRPPPPPREPEYYGTGSLIYDGSEVHDLLKYLDGMCGDTIE